MGNEIVRISSGAKWENVIGYSRAVKSGSRIIIGGTTAIDENSNIVGPGNVYEQTKYIFRKIEGYLKQAGASFEDVVLNRIYVADRLRMDEAGKAHAEFFGQIKPCCTMIEVKGFIDPDMLVEIETEAAVH